jgi:hypothetical protein
VSRTVRQAPPAPVRGAFALRMAAVAAGAFETTPAVGRVAVGGPGPAAGIAAGTAGPG